jgi:hypothetical protein
MRRWALVLSVCVGILCFGLTVHAGDAALCGLVSKVHTFVTDSNRQAMYAIDEEASNKALAALKAKYAPDLAKLEALAAKDKGLAKQVWDALGKFQANLKKCAECVRAYRHLDKDLTEYERCKEQYCYPLNAAEHEISKAAWSCKKK